MGDAGHAIALRDERRRSGGEEHAAAGRDDLHGRAIGTFEKMNLSDRLPRRDFLTQRGQVFI